MVDGNLLALVGSSFPADVGVRTGAERVLFVGRTGPGLHFSTVDLWELAVVAVAAVGIAAVGSCCSAVALGMVVAIVRGCCSIAGGYRTTEVAAPSWAAFDQRSGSSDDSRCFLPSHCRQIPNFRHPHNVMPSVSTTIAYRFDRLAMQLLV